MPQIKNQNNSSDITKFHGNNLFKIAKKHFQTLPDFRNPDLITYTLSDILMSGLALFVLKFPSLLKFEKWCNQNNSSKRLNLKNIFGIKNTPSDTRMREVLDKISPQSFNPLFKKYFKLALRQKKIRSIKSLNNLFFFSIDGTQAFFSNKISCSNCLKTVNKEKNSVSYSHKFLAAACVDPKKESPPLPVGFEMIEGFDKDNSLMNDCEQSAFKRMIDKLHNQFPKLKQAVLADALHSTVPMIKKLKSLCMSFILNVKPTRHKKLFRAFEKRKAETDKVIEYRVVEEIGDKVKKKREHIFEMTNALVLVGVETNESINFLNYKEVTTWISPKGEMKEEIKKFSWVTDISLTTHVVWDVMRAGRSRWQIENETFNTLKNHGYEFEHNYGHGEEHLCSVFSGLCLLAFLIDNLQRLGCKVMQKVLKKQKRFLYYVDDLRATYQKINELGSWDELLRLLSGELTYELRVIDSS